MRHRHGARVTCALQKRRESQVVHSPSVSIQHLLRFRWTSIVVANILFPTLNLFQLWRNEISNLGRRAFPQHKRLWRIARRIYSIYAAISLHSSQRQRLHQTTAAQISQVSSQLVTPNGHDLFDMALENTRPSRSKPVQSQCVQTSQVQKDNVRLAVSSYI